MQRRRMQPGDPMSPKQKRFYDAVVNLYRSLNRPPTFREVRTVLRASPGYRYTEIITALRLKGWLAPRGRLAPLRMKPYLSITSDDRVRLWCPDQVLSLEEATQLAGKLVEAVQHARRQADGATHLFRRKPLAGK